jgi:F0F1-type ATP synthase membrane subunit b/b'
VREKLIQSIETLRNLCYLTQNLKGDQREYIEELKNEVELVSENNLQQALEDIQSQIERAKELVGCKLSDDEINRAAKWLTSVGDGYVCLSK